MPIKQRKYKFQCTYKRYSTKFNDQLTSNSVLIILAIDTTSRIAIKLVPVTTKVLITTIRINIIIISQYTISWISMVLYIFY